MITVLNETSVTTDNEPKYSIVNEDPSIKFNFDNRVSDPNNETAYTLTSIDYDGWRKVSVAKNVWQQLVNYCQEQLNS